MPTITMFVTTVSCLWLVWTLSAVSASLDNDDGWSWGTSHLEADIARLEKLDISSYFTDEEITAMSNKRVRREIRDIEYAEWKKVAAAMNVMKFTDQVTGMAKYGDKFWNYDKLVCFHARVSWSKVGDLNHLNPAFSPWHRSYSLMFEESILAIDSSIDAVPYWDYRRDVDEPLNSIVWTELYFGELMGDTDKGYGIRNGPFGYWPINEDAQSLGCEDVHNMWGQMRNPVHQEKSQYVTRMGSAMCNKTNTEIGTVAEWNECLDVASYGSYVAVDNCYEGTFHFYSHVFVGGSRDPDNPRVIKMNASYDADSDSCLTWSGNTDIDIAPHKIEILYAHPEFECFDCPTDCTINDDSVLCTSCKVVNTTCTFEKHNVTYTANIATETDEFIWGDMSDPIASPNDPFFWFHHINLDRFIFIWQLHLWDERPYYWYPTSGYEYGINLDDIAGDEYPFTNLFDMYEKDKQMTYRDIFDATTFVNCPYAYDDVIAALHRGQIGKANAQNGNMNQEGMNEDGESGTTSSLLARDNLVLVLLGVVSVAMISIFVKYFLCQNNDSKISQNSKSCQNCQSNENAQNGERGQMCQSCQNLHNSSILIHGTDSNERHLSMKKNTSENCKANSNYGTVQSVQSAYISFE